MANSQTAHRVNEKTTKKIYRWPGIFLVDLEMCQIAWKVPKYTEKFSDSFNRGRKETIGKVFRWPGKFPDGLDKFQMAYTISRWPGKFPDGLAVTRWLG